MAYKCNECGKVFDDARRACPNCGCPASECQNIDGRSINVEEEIREDSNIPNSMPTNSIDLKHHPLTKGYYHWWSPLQSWYIPNLFNVKEQHRFDAINEWFLFNNLLGRAFLRMQLILIVAYVICAIIIVIGVGLGHEYDYHQRVISGYTSSFSHTGQIIGIIIVSIICFFILVYTMLRWFPRALAHYWPLIHILWHRIVQRVWSSIHKSIERNKIEDLVIWH